MINPREILFFDIETAAETQTFDWYSKAKAREQRYCKGVDPAFTGKFYYESAWLYPEFSKVVCISYWQYEPLSQQWCFGSFVWDEESILSSFAATLASSRYISGHNIKQFDVPYLMKRYIVNKLKVPGHLNSYGKKPWEMTNMIDTMEIWKGTGFSGTSLEVCSLACWLPNPKEEFNWLGVFQMFYAGEINLIKEYCEWDVKATVRVYNELYMYL